MSLTATEQKTRSSAQPPRLLGSRSRWLGFGIGVLLIIVFFSLATEDWFSIVNYTMIAAIALANGLTVVTHNTAEFSRVPGLRIEDWHLP